MVSCPSGVMRSVCWSPKCGVLSRCVGLGDSNEDNTGETARAGCLGRGVLCHCGFYTVPDSDYLGSWSVRLGIRFRTRSGLSTFWPRVSLASKAWLQQVEGYA